VLHIVSAPLALGYVEATVDWTRRFDLMQQHTGQHILSQAFIQRCDASTVGFHLGSEIVTIDVDKADLNVSQLEATERLANQVVMRHLDITTRLISPDQADGIRMRRVPEALATDGLRIVVIGDFDTTACGGTHVAHTGEIGMIKLLSTEKYKGGTRVTFVCGERALAAMQMYTTLLNALASDLTCAITDLPAIVTRLRADGAANDKTIKALREQLVEYAGAELITTAQVRGSVRVVASAYPAEEAATLRSLATRITREAGMVALLATYGERVQVVCARSADVAIDMNGVLKVVLAPLGGKGGGQPASAQGGAGAATQEQVIRALNTATETII
jgi:alanyl-tRNA synthetase